MVYDYTITHVLRVEVRVVHSDVYVGMYKCDICMPVDDYVCKGECSAMH